MSRNVFTLLLVALCTFSLSAQFTIDGELKKWHKISLTFEGPTAQESATSNPFLDYRLNVTFRNGDQAFTVPGFFAADGQAAETSAEAGNKWRVHFTPNATGEWTFETSFRKGENIAISLEPDEGNPEGFDGTTGSFTVTNTDKSGRDLRGKGRLQYTGDHYLRFAETGDYFIKIGADAPENFLAYKGFDNTPNYGDRRKSWQPHIRDWRRGDPIWQNDKGQGIIGAINYLAGEGQNVFSFLTMNIEGDDKNVFPYISDSPNDRTRMDCSKLDQWEIVFEHADLMGMYLHFKTQETENDQLLDGGELGTERKLYYRELIARFAHHLALNWNIGEENTNTDSQRKAFAQYIQDLDPYDHHIVVHTYPGQREEVYNPLLGEGNAYSGASIQTDWANVHKATLKWVRQSAQSGKKWVVANDEQGSANTGVPHDAYAGTPDQLNIRNAVLWGNLMAGGAGVEYYFGYKLPESDLTCQDFRSRDRLWDYNRFAHEFFTKYISFWEMESADERVGNSNNNNDKFCLADDGKSYVIYLANGGSTNLDLGNFDYSYQVRWYDPRNGGTLQRGSFDRIAGPGIVSIGNPPSESDQDWVVLVTVDPRDCPVAGQFCDDGDPATINDETDGECGCEGEPCPPAGTICNDGNPNTIDDQEDGFCNCAGTNPNATTDFWLEAECGVVGENWEIKNSDQAGNGTFLMASANENDLDVPPVDPQNWISFTINLTQAGSYALFARTITTEDGDDSFWVQVNNSSWLKWNKINAGNYSNDFQWSQAGNWTSGENSTAVRYALAEGEINIKIGIREPGAKIDKLLFTVEELPPSGIGEEDPGCVPDCPPASTPCNDGNDNTENDQWDGNCNCSGTEPEVTTDLWLEAECAIIGSNWTIDEDDNASEQKVVSPPDRGALGSPSSNPDDLLTFKVDIEEAGSYTLFGRTQTSSNRGDSYWVRVNGGDWINWNRINLGNHSSDYQWDRVGSWNANGGSTSGAFEEQEGLVVIEMESADALPEGWKTGPSPDISSPDINDVQNASGGAFIVWQGEESPGQPGNDLLIYEVQINTTGTYKFQWRNQVGKGNNTTTHNDTWLKIEADAFYGQKADSHIVCPKGTMQNDCSGEEPNGAGAGGWFKVYSNSADSWSWSTNTSDSDPHEIFARFDAPGLYRILVAARSSHHVLDRMVLSRTTFNGNAQDILLGESERKDSGTGTRVNTRFDLSAGETIIDIADRESGVKLDKLLLTLGGEQPTDQGAVATNCDTESCPPAGTGCDDGNPNTDNDRYDNNCNCVGDPCPAAGTTCDDGNPNTENDQWDGNCNCVGDACPPAGTTCDDGNSNTENDRWDGDCNCVGDPCPAVGTACDDGDPNTENDQWDGSCNCIGENILDVGTIWLEAECADVGNNWTFEESTAASNNEYLIAPDRNSYNTPPSGTNDLVTFVFDIEKSGLYAIFARTMTKDGDSDSFWFRVDGGSWYKWNLINAPDYGNMFQWDQAGSWTGGKFSDPVEFTFGRGQHVLEVAWREGNLGLDKISIQFNTTEPIGKGAQSTQDCANCPPAGTLCDDGNPNTVDDQEDGFCNCFGIDPNGATTFWLEAECASIGERWAIVDDINASGEQYVNPPSSTSYNKAPNRPVDWVSFDFTVSMPGTYHIFARTFTTNGGDDSFWVKVNNGDWIKWNRINAQNYAPVYQWAKVGAWKSGNEVELLSFDLEPGPNVVKFAWREGGARLDKIAILNNDQIPSDLGEPAQETCNDCLPEDTPCDDGDPVTTLDLEDGQCNCIGFRENNEPGLWLEAECANYGEEWRPMGSNDASGGGYLLAPEKNSFINPHENERDLIRFDFDIPEAGDYKIYVRSLALDEGSNSVWARINGGEWIRWNKINHRKGNVAFVWDQLGVWNRGDSLATPLTFTFRRGANTLEFGWREANLAIDKLQITTANEQPVGMGLPDPDCSSADFKNLDPEDIVDQPHIFIKALYPNPVSNILVVEYTSQLNGAPIEQAKVEVKDFFGRVMSSEMKGIQHFGEIIVDVNNLPPGSYVVTIQIEERIFYKRFIK